LSEYRERVPVLCGYRVYKRYGKATIREHGQILIKAEFSDQIQDEFKKAMEQRKLEYLDWANVFNYEMTSYYPANGKANW